MKSNRFAEIKNLCAQEMFDELLALAVDEDMTPEEAEAAYKELMGEKPEEKPKRAQEIVKEKPKRLKEIEEIEERNLYIRWLREMREKGLLEKMEEEGMEDPSKAPFAVFRRLRESGKFAPAPRVEKVKPTIPHRVKEEEEAVPAELPFEGETMPAARKYTPGAITAKKCSVCGFLNSPVYLGECKHCKRLYEWMKELVEEKDYSLHEAIMEVYKPFRDLPAGANFWWLDRISSKTRNFVSPDVLKYIYRTEGETRLNPEDVVELEGSSPYMRIQSLLDTVLNVQRDPKTKMPIYDEEGDPIPLDREMRKYISLSELAKRLLMSDRAVVQRIGEYNSEKGLIPARYYIPGQGKEPFERPRKPEEDIPRKGTGIGPVRDFSIYPTREKAQLGMEPKYHQIYEASRVMDAFKDRLAELPSIFRQLKIRGFENRINRMGEEIENLRVRIRVIEKSIKNYKKFRNYRSTVAKALKELEGLSETGEVSPRQEKLNRAVGHLLDERNKKLDKLNKERIKVIENLKETIEKKKKEEERRDKYEKWVAKKYPKPLTLKDLIEMQRGINIDELQEEVVAKEEGKPEKKSMRERINTLLKLAVEELYLPGMEPEKIEEEPEEPEPEEVPEGLAGVKFFQPGIGEKRPEPNPELEKAPIKTMTKEEIEAEIKKLEGPKIDDTFGDKKGKYTVYFEFKIRTGPDAGRVKRFRARFQYTPEYRKIPFEVLLQRKIEQRFKQKIIEAGATPGTYVRMVVNEPESAETRTYSFFLDKEGKFEWLSTLKEERAEKERLLRQPENAGLYKLWESGDISLDQMAIVGGKLVEKDPVKKTHYYKWLKKKLKTIEQSEKATAAREKAKRETKLRKKKIEELRKKELAGLTPEEIKEKIKEEKEELKLKFEPREPEYKEPEEVEKDLVKVKCPHCKRDNWVEKGKESIETCKACEFPAGDLTFVVKQKMKRREEVQEKVRVPIPQEERVEGGPTTKEVTMTVEKKIPFYKYSMVSFQRDAQGSLASAKCWEVPARAGRFSRETHKFEAKRFPDLWKQVIAPFEPLIKEIRGLGEAAKERKEKGLAGLSPDEKKRKREIRKEIENLKETKDERYKELVEQEHPGEPLYKTVEIRAPMVGPPRKPCAMCPEAKPPFSEAPCAEIRSAYKYMIGEDLPFVVTVWPAAQLMDIERVIERKYGRFDRIYNLYKISQKPAMEFTLEEAGIKPPAPKIKEPKWTKYTPTDLMKAKDHYEKGLAAFRMGNFNKALKEYETGYTLTREPGFLFNMGQAYRELGDKKKAAWLYKSYLKSPKAQDKAGVQALIKELESTK